MVSEDEAGIAYPTGDSRWAIYLTEAAGRCQDTLGSLTVEDIEAPVEELQPSGPTEVAWFKDPDGGGTSSRWPRRTCRE